MDFDDNRRGAEVNLAIIALNVIFFLFLELNGGTENTENMIRYGAVFAPLVLGAHQYWRLLTAVFMHFGIWHIASNMLILFVLGDNLERALGHVKYLVFYLLCGVGANAVSLYVSVLANEGNYAVGAGASGAIFGVIGGLLCAVIKNRGRLEDLSTRQLAILSGFELISGFTTAGVDVTAHLAGFVLGFLLALVMYRGKRTGWETA